MKTIYIPEGQSVSYENLTIDRLVVDGYVHVSGELTVKHVSGHGTLSAGDISANSIRVDELEAGVVYCNRLAAGVWMRRTCTRGGTSTLPSVCPRIL